MLESKDMNYQLTVTSNVTTTYTKLCTCQTKPLAVIATSCRTCHHTHREHMSLMRNVAVAGLKQMHDLQSTLSDVPATSVFSVPRLLEWWPGLTVPYDTPPFSLDTLCTLETWSASHSDRKTASQRHIQVVQLPQFARRLTCNS